MFTLDAARRDKSLTENCCSVLFMMSEFMMLLAQISNDFQRLLYRVQCSQTLAVAAWHVRFRDGVTRLSRRNKATSASNRKFSTPWVLSDIWYLHGSYFLLYYSTDVLLFCFFIFLSLGCSLNALSTTSRVDTPLTADWLQVCFGTLPRLCYLKHLFLITYPTFNRH